ncbi:MAG: hypothetical protein AB7G87_10870 [Clostridia bacterium]
MDIDLSKNKIENKMNYKIEDEIVEFELAMKAKEAGFSNGSKYAYIYNAEDAKSSFCNMSMVVYNTDNSGFVEAPTASVLSAWLMDVKGVDVIVNKNGMYYNFSVYNCIGFAFRESVCNKYTYEEALLAGLSVAIDIVIETNGI